MEGLAIPWCSGCCRRCSRSWYPPPARPEWPRWRSTPVPTHIPPTTVRHGSLSASTSSCRRLSFHVFRTAPFSRRCLCAWRQHFHRASGVFPASNIIPVMPGGVTTFFAWDTVCQEVLSTKSGDHKKLPPPRHEATGSARRAVSSLPAIPDATRSGRYPRGFAI